jgi:hypothetical protein
MAILPTTPEGQPGDDGTSPLILIQRAFVTFIRGLFAQVPVGGPYHWEEPTPDHALDQEGSTIWIGTDTPIDPELVGLRPAITVSRGPAAFHGLGLGDRAFIDWKTGAVSKMDMLPTTVGINVLSRVPFEAEQLAWFVARHIWNLRDELLRGNTYALYAGNRPSLSPPSPAGSLVAGPDTEHNWVCVNINFPVYLQHLEVSMPLNKPILGEIVVVATAQGPRTRIRRRVPLQGTAVNQPEQTRADRTTSSSTSGSEASGSLPQTGSDEAQSTEPLTVQIKT